MSDDKKDDLIPWELFDKYIIWYAKDPDDSQWLFENEPSLRGSDFFSFGYVIELHMIDLTPGIPWNESKRKRPTKSDYDECDEGGCSAMDSL